MNSVRTVPCHQLPSRQGALLGAQTSQSVALELALSTACFMGTGAEQQLGQFLLSALKRDSCLVYMGSSKHASQASNICFMIYLIAG